MQFLANECTSLPGSSAVGANPKMEPAHELVVEGILQAEGSHGGVYPDARAIAIAAAGLPPRTRRVPKHALPAVQVCSIVKEQRALQNVRQTMSAALLHHDVCGDICTSRCSSTPHSSSRMELSHLAISAYASQATILHCPRSAYGAGSHPRS